MGDNDGFACDLSALRQLIGQLGEHAGAAGSLSETLGSITANTGRPDSDEMGRIGPGAAADLLGALRGELTDDSGKVDACAALYSTIEGGNRSRFSTDAGRS
jgi:hypothetical protein